MNGGDDWIERSPVVTKCPRPPCYSAMSVMAFYPVVPPYVQLFMFGLSFFFTNFGPNTTTFIIPSEIFPTAVKTTCHGLSAAVGKVGAVVGSAAFPPLKESISLGGILISCSLVALLGLVCTILFLPKVVVDREKYAERIGAVQKGAEVQSDKRVRDLL